jgi:hypothetical protein
MFVEWKITEADIEIVQTALQRAAGTDIFEKRTSMIQKPVNAISRELFWEKLVISRFTTQVRITRNGALTKLPRGPKFPFELTAISRMRSPSKLIKIMNKFHVGRDRNTAASEFIANARWITNNGWNDICSKLAPLFGTHGYEKEREVAEFLRLNLKGIGPKQSRNLLQALGLIWYETPIDSRVTKWLNNELSFPLVVTPQALADPAVYHFILDGVRALCERSGVLPTLLDAAVFGD